MSEATDEAAPYLALTEALRDLARSTSPRAWERLRASAPPELAGLLPGAPPELAGLLPGAPPELAGLLPGAPAGRPARADPGARGRLLVQVRDLLAEVAAAAPLLLVLEDVH